MPNDTIPTPLSLRSNGLLYTSYNSLSGGTLGTQSEKKINADLFPVPQPSTTPPLPPPPSTKLFSLFPNPFSLVFEPHLLLFSNLWKSLVLLLWLLAVLSAMFRCCLLWLLFIASFVFRSNYVKLAMLLLLLAWFESGSKRRQSWRWRRRISVWLFVHSFVWIFFFCVFLFHSGIVIYSVCVVVFYCL